MRRRSYLAGLAAALAGCMGSNGSGDGGTPQGPTEMPTETPPPPTETSTPTRTETPTPTPTPTPSPPSSIERRWSAEASGPLGPRLIDTGGDQVVWATGREILSYSLSDGKRRWKAAPEVEAIGLLVTDDAVYVADAKSWNLVALDPDSGTRRWTTGLDATANPASMAYAGLDGYAAVSQRNADGSEGATVIVDAATGERVWTVRDAPALALVGDGETLFFGGANGITAYDAAGQSQLWDAPDAPVSLTAWRPRVDADRLYTAGLGSLVALDRTTGQRQWSASPPAGSPALGAGVLAFGDPIRKSPVVALEATSGKKLWEFTPESPSIPPSVAGGAVFTNDTRKTLVGLSPSDGSTLVSTELPSEPTVAVGVDDGLYVSTFRQVATYDVR